MLVYISGQNEWFDAEGRCAVVTSGRTRDAFATATSTEFAAVSKVSSQISAPTLRISLRIVEAASPDSVVEFELLPVIVWD